MKKDASNEAIEPDIEVVVRTGKQEVGLFGIFRAGATEWDVVVGIDQTHTRDGIQSALQLALDALSRAAFVETRTIRPWGGGDKAEAP